MKTLQPQNSRSMIFNPQSKVHKGIAYLVTFSMYLTCFYSFPGTAQAAAPNQGNGGQAETQNFHQANMSSVVNPFNGDFNYNIPLMSVGGYPINLSYNDNIQMETQAGWVGLGWSLHPGSINRNLRGLPDDFNGDLVTKESSARVDLTEGTNLDISGQASAGVSAPIIPVSVGASLGYTVGSYRNSYRGAGYIFSRDLNRNFEVPIPGVASSFSGSAGKSISFDTQNGIGLSRSLGYTLGYSIEFAPQESQSTTWNFNTRAGLTDKTRTNASSTNYHFYSQGVGTSSKLTYGTPSYVPFISRNTFGTGFFEKTAFGSIVPQLSGSAAAGVENYETTKDVLLSSTHRPAYGYFYSEQVDETSAIMDVNREKESFFTENTPNLPLAHLTYDIFSVSGQGIGGMVRAHRHEVGVVKDPENGTNIIQCYDAELYSLVPPGASTTTGVTKSTITNKVWDDQGNTVGDRLQFAAKDAADIEDETYYFKFYGESTPYQSSYFDQYGGFLPTKVGIDRVGTNIQTTGGLISYNTDGTANPSQQIPLNNIRSKQQRNTMLSSLSAEEASALAVVKTIESYALFDAANEDGISTVTTIDRVSEARAAHHLSEMTVTAEGGAQYVYGIPVYTTASKNVVFNASGRADATTCEEGTVAYVHDGTNPDNSTANALGRDQFFEAQHVPGFSNSFLLTAVLSNDYVDVTSDGPSEDDLGDYVKFNYTQLYDQADPYKERMPYSMGDPTSSDYPKAWFDEGFKSDLEDDRASYQYTEKEIWYTHSIETREYIAEFILEDREDGYGVVDENGGIETAKPLKKLVRIELYQKEQRRLNGANAIPLQVVHFEYDYSLCPNFPANVNGGGKLTLKKVYTTYQNSRMGQLSDYEFVYATSNPAYDPTSQDRWRNYKDNNCSAIANRDFPYVDQQSTTLDADVSSWKLSQIQLPTGGRLVVEYEADRYVHVQNKAAMNMVTLLGVGDDAADPLTEVVQGRIHDYEQNDDRPRDILFFGLNQTISGSQAVAEQEFEQHFIKNLLNREGELFYKCLVDVTGEGDYEYVSGFTTIRDFGLYGNGPNYTIGWVRIGDIKLNDEGPNRRISEIGKTAIQYVRQNLPNLVYPSFDDLNCGNKLTCFLQSFELDAASIWTGELNRAMAKKGYANTLVPQDSWIRLYSSKEKYGGGSRVKSIKMYDDWSNMGGTQDHDYGIEYDYTMTLEDGSVVSSGVASWEPSVGNEENPFHVAESFTVENRMFPDETHYQVGPFGESFFPAGEVGYRKVTMKNIDRANVTQNVTGTTELEFYTALEFPTLTAKTPLGGLEVFETPEDEVLDGEPQIRRVGASQGYAITLNDMHGKTRSSTTFDAAGEKISEQVVRYKTTSAGNALDNFVTVLNADQSYSETTLSIDMDITVDQRRSTSETSTLLTTETVSVSNLLSFVLPSTDIFDSHSTNELYTSTITKVIHTYGMVDEVETTYLGSKVIQKPLAYDAETGRVLITSTQNNFDDPIYSIAVPARWAYEGMAQAVTTQGNGLSTTINSSGQVVLAGANDYFYPGDQLMVTGNGAPYRLWVHLVDGNEMYLIDALGNPATAVSGVDLKVIQSGKINQFGTSMTSFATLENPVPNPTGSLVVDEIINATALEFSDAWQAPCDVIPGCAVDATTCVEVFNPSTQQNEIVCTTSPVDYKATCGEAPGNLVNPFRNGLQSNWRPIRSYVYRTGRTNGAALTASEIRTDGIYTAFTPFWDIENNAWTRIQDRAGFNGQTENWLLTSEVTSFNPKGMAQEAKDVLGLYSSTLYGYNDNLVSLPIASASNAKYTQIAFDSFEDYTFRDDVATCDQPGHWNFRASVQPENLTQQEHHTGRYSLKLIPGEAQAVTRFIRDCDDQGVPKSVGPEGYQMGGCDCLQPFSPETGTYVVGAWVKENHGQPVSNYQSAQITVVTKDAGGTVLGTNTFRADGPFIEGWRRIEATFEVPANAACIEVRLENNGLSVSGSGVDVFFDDVRIHPFLSLMGARVYDPTSMRVMATLDDRNFATFYEYDERGILVRVKAETVDGLRTIQESRSGVQKDLN